MMSRAESVWVSPPPRLGPVYLFIRTADELWMNPRRDGFEREVKGCGAKRRGAGTHRELGMLS